MTFMTHVLFIGSPQTVYIPWNHTSHCNSQYHGPIALLLYGSATHVTPRVPPYATSEGIPIVRLADHSSYLTRQLDLCVLGPGNNFLRKGKQSKGNERRQYSTKPTSSNGPGEPHPHGVGP
jgi:hypothetical protein